MGGYLGRWFYSNSGDSTTDSDTNSVSSDTNSVMSSDTSYMTCDASNLEAEVTSLNFKPATSRSVQPRHVMMFTASTRAGGGTGILCSTHGCYNTLIPCTSCRFPEVPIDLLDATELRPHTLWYRYVHVKSIRGGWIHEN